MAMAMQTEMVTVVREMILLVVEEIYREATVETRGVIRAIRMANLKPAWRRTRFSLLPLPLT